ncbi:SRPBCC domain-containing protein [Georgenia sp. TF02-10]|uniref:SRPBCC family protein n=1 Tax=Georgenia sp. TF02-10 TaxID=2917725 RepID=UPI001FA6B310|nr:SRPBCC domain-containing protein [Georgenia sp. TF02-10]UNX55541.1 SRPBCC domain-containing protein [Georgenia sp. TF02-10]
MPSPAVSRPTARGDFTITRRFTAPVEDVFDAWTRPEQVAAWFGPVGLVTPVDRLAMDVRPGGSWTLTMVSQDTGEEYPVEFAYVEVLRPSRLVMTTGTAEATARITVTLQPVEEGTEMTFAVTDLRTSPENGSLREGWESSFGRLAALLGEPA